MLLFSEQRRWGETAQGKLQGHLSCICHPFGIKKQVFDIVIFTYAARGVFSSSPMLSLSLCFPHSPTLSLSH